MGGGSSIEQKPKIGGGIMAGLEELEELNWITSLTYYILTYLLS
jgi:hypothetical protein